jgi:hypothetical protein
MKEISIAALPVRQFFWRTCGERWYKDDEEHGSLIGETVTRLIPLPSRDEVVLSDPCKCDVCWADLPNYPPALRCPECGSVDESRSSLESLRGRISAWSGHPRPHI